MSVVIRPATRADAAAWLDLVDALADYEKLERPDATARERLIADGFARTPPRFDVWLAFDEGAPAPIGYAIALETYSSFLARPTLYLEDLFVRPDARGRGAGNAFFSVLVDEALRRGCGRMEWVCLDWNELAIAFYERRGAILLDDWRYYRLTEEGMRALAKRPS